MAILRGHGGGECGCGGVGGGGFLGASLAGYEDANAFNHLGWGASTLGEEDIGAEGAVEGVDGAGDDHGRQAGVELLGAADEFVAVHLGHDEVAEQEVDGARERALDVFEGLLRALGGNYAVATSFQEKGAYGEDLFVVVDTENGFLRAQCSLGSAAGDRNGALRRIGPAATNPGWGTMQSGVG